MTNRQLGAWVFGPTHVLQKLPHAQNWTSSNYFFWGRGRRLAAEKVRQMCGIIIATMKRAETATAGSITRFVELEL